jgi:hypothetical protein
MVLVEGENADGVTVEEDNFDIAVDDGSATLSASDQVISAILGTREGATDAGHLLTSTGVTWTDQVGAAALREALAARKVENVMLVSAFMAAAALAQTVGSATDTARTALLFLEPDSATLAVVDSADGSIADVQKQSMPSDDAVAELARMVAGLDALEPRPEGVFVVGSGVDIAAIKPRLEAVTSLPVSAAEEPETALAWGAALASANAPLFASSTAALAYAQDPGTGEIDPHAVAPGYLATPDGLLGTELGEDDVAYSAIPDEEAETNTVVLDAPADDLPNANPRRPVLLASSVLAIIFVTAALALEVALALGIRPTVALRPNPGQQLIIPTKQAPAPVPAQKAVSTPQLGRLRAPTVAHPPASAPIAGPAPAVGIPALIPAPLPAPVIAAPVPIPLPLPVLIPLGPPVHIPAPEPPVVHPVPPVHAPAPQPPVHLPAPEPPVHAPVPPVHAPAPVAPLLPVVPPVPQAPQLPQIGVPPAQGPSFNPFGGGDHGSGGFGGGHGGGGPFGGPGGPGGGGPFGGPGGFGGGHGFGGPGGFGGGHGFGGGGGGFGGGHGFGGFGGGHSFGGFGGGHR